ncbi:MAG: ATP-dependent DNA helicase RecG [Tenericutes bacterium]|nr:ATP-dependent DNA helicase RecG [Mycoplasmatota bacterium]
MLEDIKGIGPKTLKLFQNLNIFTIQDLITYYPYKYKLYHPVILDNYEENTEVLINGYVASDAKIYYIKRNLNKISFRLNTGTKLINVTIFNRPFIKQHLLLNKYISVIGKYNIKTNTFTASDIKLTPIIKDEIEPIYHTTQGLKQVNIHKIINNLLEKNIYVPSLIPEEYIKEYSLLDKLTAIKEIHNPTSTNNLKQAEICLKYEELFEYTLKINYLKYLKDKTTTSYIKTFDTSKLDNLIASLPFKLTDSQVNAIEDIKNDFNSPKHMNRLILGDVGSGKTIISFLALYMNYLSGYQGVLMAPTEILIKQHYENIKKILTDLNIEILTGSTTKKDRDKIIENLKNGQIDILLSTHSVLNDDVVFKNIGLVVTDEQHRFGVNQRKNLQNKGENVDVLYMSATPIPRTLALTIFKDMDITEIKTKPLNRKPKITKLYKTSEIKEVLYEMLDEIKKGHQIYVVSSLIENEEENTKLASVNYLYEKINVALNGKVPIGVLHGKLKNEEKENIMNDFKSNKTKILISTTIIEIGVDVSNATMIVIFNAERFGLATLHQLRGRIGRNDIESKCILISDYDRPRLKILEESEDGFYISEKDFELRGAGDLFGVKQSGDMVFKIANLNKDFKILKKCSEDSLNFLNKHINEIDKYPIQKNIISGVKNLN